uniref:G_PROTEIN_RECEP_F1_2 domain-containing protein n=1 Tax=Parastrongyloides trichosuri TaxID=131310 RepID=A0A0N4ZTR4_PARTI
MFKYILSLLLFIVFIPTFVTFINSKVVEENNSVSTFIASLKIPLNETNDSVLPLNNSNGKILLLNNTGGNIKETTMTTYNIRMIISIVQLILVFLGLANILIILVVLIKPYMRSITNVYIVSLCLADFIYLSNLVLVVSTQYNNREWPFGEILCTTYHGTETTGKFASVLFVVLLAGDRYCAMCLSHLCNRFRTYKLAITASIIAWFIAILAASPLYMFASVIQMKNYNGNIRTLCIAKWPYQALSHYYVGTLTILIYIIPLILIVYFYYHIINKLREAVKSSKRLKRASKTRASYHRVTRLVLWVVIFHVISWSPFWMYNIVNSIFKLRPTSHFDRIFANIIHLFPYINCALNPFLYAAAAENFQTAFKSLLCINSFGKRLSIFEKDNNGFTNGIATSVLPRNIEYHKLPAPLIPQSVLVFSQNNMSEGACITVSSSQSEKKDIENVMVNKNLTTFNTNNIETSFTKLLSPNDDVRSNEVITSRSNLLYYQTSTINNNKKKISFKDSLEEELEDNITKTIETPILIKENSYCNKGLKRKIPKIIEDNDSINKDLSIHEDDIII